MGRSNNGSAHAHFAKLALGIKCPLMFNSIRLLCRFNSLRHDIRCYTSARQFNALRKIFVFDCIGLQTDNRGIPLELL